MIEHRCVDGCVPAMTVVRPLRPRSLTCTLLALQLLLKSTAQALVFLFPNHSDDVITVPENTEIRIQFGVEGLESLQQSQLLISVYNTTEERMLKICSIIYYTNNRSYMISDEKIICVNQTGPVPLMFRTRVSRWDDKRTLVWQVIGVKDLQKAFRLDVTYPATVVSLTFTHEPSVHTSIVEEGSTSVQLICLWVNGNPPSAARFLDRKRQELTHLDAGTTSDNLTYRLTYSPKKINCSSSGVITCEVLGAEVNRSVTLLVRCPPEFQAVNGTPIKFDNRNTSMRIVYRVRAHTNVTEKCELKKLQSTSQKALVFLLPQTAFRCLLTGQPPDLMLTVVMDDMNYVTEGEEQLWRLELTNDKGTGSVEFSLPIVVGDNKNSNGSTFNLNIIIIGGGAGGGLVLIIIIIVVVVKCRKSRDVNIQNIAGIVAEKQAARKSDSSAGTGAGAAGNDSKSGGSSARSSSSGSDKPSSNPNYTSTALQEVEIHAYMDLHTRDPTYAATASKKDNHTYIELRTKRMQSEPPQPPAEGSRNSAIYANQGRSPKAPVLEEEDEDEDEANYYNTAR